MCTKGKNIVSINFKSISPKLILGGIVSVLVPMIIVGHLSYSKSETALVDLSYKQAEGIAEDLSQLSEDLKAMVNPFKI